MKEKLDLKKYEQELNNKNYDLIYQDIKGKFIELAKEIADLKKIDFPNKEDNNLLHEIDNLFEEEFHMFEIVSMLAFQLTLWNDESIFNDSKKEKIDNYINLYNSSLDLLDEYQNISNEIKIKGYKEVINEKIKRLETLFKEMLAYKNKEYEETADFNTLVPKISQYYNYFHESLYETKSAVDSHYVRYSIESELIYLDDVEVIHQLDDLYEELTNYKHFANFYRDFELTDGQTFEDLYEQEKTKMITLFKEMLDYRNIKYEKETFEYLKVEVGKAYPCYRDMIYNMSMSDTYIRKLNALEDVYEYLSERYKNYEEDLKDYKDDENTEFIEEEID